MIRTTAFLLIVLSVSPKSNYAGLDEPHQVLCDGSDTVHVALIHPSATLTAEAKGNGEDGLPLNVHPDAETRRWVYVVIHHSATSRGSVEGIHAEHSRRRDSSGNFWLGIGYHFVIGNGNGMPDGQIESTFRWRQQLHGAHSGSAVHNANGIGICLIGNFEETVPTKKQLESVTQLVKALASRNKIPARLVIGHNTVKPTACPGKKFPLQEVVREAVPNTPADSASKIPFNFSLLNHGSL